MKNNNEHLPEAYKQCSKVTRATFKDDKHLPILMGISKNNSDKVFFSLGHENPYVMTKGEAKYLVQAVNSLYNQLFEEDNSNVSADVNLTDGFQTPENEEVKASKELKELIEGKTEEIKEVFNKIKQIIKENTGEEISEDEVQQMIDGKKDLENIFENLSTEEKEELEKQMIEERRKRVDEHFEDLESELLGTIRKEELPEFTFEYFEEVFKDKGLAFLKEELAKLPKQNRESMIKRFVDKYESFN